MRMLLPIVQSVQETRSCDGTVDRLNGECKQTRFSNGTVTKELPDGTCAVHFANGDVKQTFPSGMTVVVIFGCLLISFP